MTGDKIIVQNLERRVRELSLLNEAYKAHIINLENTFNNLENQIQSLKLVKQDFLSKEEIYLNEKIEVAQKDQKILDLQQDIINLKIQHEKFKNKKELEYDNDVTAVKNFYQTQLLKNESSENVERINKLFYDTILKLEDKITNFEEEQKKKDAQKEIDFENRMNEMKKKMLDYIKEGQKSKQYLSKEQLRLNDKLSVIHKNTLLNELDFQSMQLEDLLKQRAHLDKIISGMKADLEIHKKVEKILTEKNKEYTDMIKVLSTKIESKEKEGENNNLSNKKDKIENDINSKIKQFKILKENTKFIRIENKNNYKKIENKNRANYIKNNINEEINIKNFGKTSVDFRNKLKVSDINENQDLIFLRKELIKKIKELEDYKSKYEYYKTKLNLINNKYGNIMQLFEGVLIDIYEDKNMKNIKNIFINLEDFQKCNFETLSPEQKYSIVILIIKYLMPLINPTNLPEKFKSLFNNIEDVTFINDKNDKGNYLLSSTSNASSSNPPNYKERSNKHDVIKTRIKSSSSDFGKTQIFFDNKYQKKLNYVHNNNTYMLKNNNVLTRNKKPNAKIFYKYISKQGSEKSIGKSRFNDKYGSLLSNFLSSLEADSFNNDKFRKTYSLFNV